MLADPLPPLTPGDMTMGGSIVVARYEYPLNTYLVLLLHLQRPHYSVGTLIREEDGETTQLERIKSFPAASKKFQQLLDESFD